MDERTQGIWWLSNDPDKRVPGELVLGDSRLDLNGCFKELKSGTTFGSKPQLIRTDPKRTILGVTKDGGKEYTLEFFDNPAYTWSMPGYKSDRYSLGTVFRGAHFEKPEDIAFHRYYIDIPYLLEWVGESVIKPQTTLTKNTMKDTKINIDPPLTIDFYEDKGLKLSFTIVPHGMYFGFVRSMHLRQSCRLKIESQESLTISKMNEIVTHFERFLMIATGKKLSATAYEAASSNLYRTIDIFPHKYRREEYKEISAYEMNFTFSDIRDNSQTIFEKWFSNRAKHADVFDLFSSLRSDTTKNLNNKFKDIISAAEGYIAIEENLKEVSPELATKKLNEMLSKGDRLLAKSDYKKIRITRNKLSHLKISVEDEKYVLDTEGKWRNYHKMLFLLEYSLLKNLGLQDSLLQDFSKKCVWR